MIKLYSDRDLLDAHKQKRRLFLIFWLVTAFVAAGFIACVVCYLLLPYHDERGNIIVAVTSVLLALYMFFAFPYCGISLKRVRAYCKMLGFISEGLKESAVLPFEDIEDWTTRDSVDVNVAVFGVKNIKRDEIMHRHIYVDGEKDFPPFEVGDMVRIVTQGNLLIEYEILPRTPKTLQAAEEAEELAEAEEAVEETLQTENNL